MRVPKGCPICQEDVMGTPETGFFCRRCNLIFRRQHIVFRYAREELKGLIDKHFGAYGKKEPDQSRERLRAADHKIDLNIGVKQTASSFEALRRSVEEAKRMVDDAEAARLQPPAPVPHEEIRIIQEVTAPKRPSTKTKKLGDTQSRRR